MEKPPEEHLLPPEVEEQIRQDALEDNMDPDAAVRAAEEVLRGEE